MTLYLLFILPNSPTFICMRYPFVQSALYYLLTFITLLLLGCSSAEKADLLVHNAVVYTVDSSFAIVQAFAVKDGKFLEEGSNEEILKKYKATQTIDAGGKAVYPGFIDAHCHFLRYGLSLQN